MVEKQLRVYIFPIFFLSLMFFPLVAEARTGISLASDVDDAAPPARWLAMLPGTDRYVAEKTDGWGFLEVPAGAYDLLIVPEGDQAIPIDMGRATVRGNEVTEINLNSGIRLESKHGLEALPWWAVVDIASNEPVAQVRGRWGFTPLPAGRYRLEAPIPGHMATTSNLQVAEETVLDVELAELGIRQLAIDMPAKHDVRLAFGGIETVAIMELNGEHFLISEEGSREPTIEFWLEAEPVAIERHNGSFVDRVEIDGRSGERVEVPFDPKGVARSRGLSLIRMSLVDETKSLERLTILDRIANRLLLSEANPSLDTWFLAPGEARIRATIDNVEVEYSALPNGTPTELELRGSANEGEDAASATIDIVIETPEDGNTFDPALSEVTVVGHASTTSAAGATKIALVIDTSGSC